jgi:hypothetical protein
MFLTTTNNDQKDEQKVINNQQITNANIFTLIDKLKNDKEHYLNSVSVLNKEKDIDSNNCLNIENNSADINNNNSNNNKNNDDDEQTEVALSTQLQNMTTRTSRLPIVSKGIVISKQTSSPTLKSPTTYQTQSNIPVAVMTKTPSPPTTTPPSSKLVKPRPTRSISKSATASSVTTDRSRNSNYSNRTKYNQQQQQQQRPYQRGVSTSFATSANQHLRTLSISSHTSKDSLSSLSNNNSKAIVYKVRHRPKESNVITLFY